MFSVKICGVTTPEDALFAVDEAGADAVGLNFYAKSPRCVSIDEAQAISVAVGDRALRVGVFVNASAEEISTIVTAVKLDAVQLHGDEPAELLAELPPGAPVIRAARIGAAGLAPVAEHLDAAKRLGRPFAAVLVDAAGSPGEYGGTGRTTDWERVAAERALIAGTPLILAGGLRPENVAAAVRATGADGVDTASGVEATPRKKDPSLVRPFVERARAALGSAPA